MRTVGFVVEYNPLHNGHRHHFETALKVTGAEACVAVMSGHFLQRGEPALVSKWARAEMALGVGIDLVIELPVPFATANAEVFAYGAVSLLDRLGVVDVICFGSESGEIGWMRTLARTLADEPADFSRALKEELSRGLSYPVAYARAAKQLMHRIGYGDVPIDQPNNILGLNYLLALERLGSRMEAVTIPRIKAGYHQESITDRQIASATALRKLIFAEGADWEKLAPFVPASTLDVLRREFARGAGPISWENFRHPLFHRLLQLTPAELSAYHEVEEGIEYRLIQAAKTSASVKELLERAKHRRFTWNRLQRMLLSVLLDLTKERIRRLNLKQGAPYARVLAFSERGRRLLHEAKRKSSIPLYTNVRDGLHPMLDLDIAAGSLYRLGMPRRDTEALTEEYRRAPLRTSSAEATADTGSPRPPS